MDVVGVILLCFLVGFFTVLGFGQIRREMKAYEDLKKTRECIRTDLSRIEVDMCNISCSLKAIERILQVSYEKGS